MIPILHWMATHFIETLEYGGIVILFVGGWFLLGQLGGGISSNPLD